MPKLSQPIYINKIILNYYFDLAKLCNTLIKKAILLSNKITEATQAKKEQY